MFSKRKVKLDKRQVIVGDRSIRNIMLMIFFLVFLANSYTEDQKVLRLIKKDKAEKIREEINKGLDIHRIYDDELLLNYASAKGSFNSVLTLIDAGADVNRFYKDVSPLIIAIRNKHVKVAERLIEHGADINLANSKGNTPFIHAAKVDDLKLIKLMFDVGADFKAANNRGKVVANYIDNLEKNPVLDYFNQMILLHRKSDSLPDMSDGPHVFLNDNEIRVEYYKHDSSKNRTWKVFKHFPANDNYIEFKGFAGDTNTYILDLDFEAEPTHIKKAHNIFAVGDLHGQTDALKVLLRNQEIIDSQGNWQWGDRRLVFTGDVFDRGDQVTEAFWYIHKLGIQARQRGGDVHLLLGNHEIMNMMGDYRYLDKKYAHFIFYFRMQQAELYGRKTYMGNWLRKKNVVLKLSDKVFVHGGISSYVLNQELSLAEINHIFRLHLDGKRYKQGYIQDLLLSANGPVWYRGYLMGENAGSKLRQMDVEKALKMYNAEMMIIGHTEQYTIRSLYNDCVYAIDVPIGREGYIAQGLMILDGKMYKCGECGSRTELER